MTEQRLLGRRALVTGAGRAGSIGREIALTLAREGADVAVNDFNRDEEAAVVEARISAMGRNAVSVPGDVRSAAACRMVVQRSVEHLGGLDILVNNAGFAHHQNVEDITEDDWDAALSLHLKGPFFSGSGGNSRDARRRPRLDRQYLVRAGLYWRGATGSLHGRQRRAAHIDQIARPGPCSRYYRQHRLHPGPTATDKFKMGAEFASGADRTLPRRRWGTPADVAQSGPFLVSSAADAYTGQTLDPNCGAVMD